jgi:hypothetical protein
MDDAETKHVIGTVLFLAVHCVARKQCHALVPRLAKAQEKPWHALSPGFRFCRSAKCESGTPQNRICLPPSRTHQMAEQQSMWWMSFGRSKLN